MATNRAVSKRKPSKRTSGRRPAPPKPGPKRSGRHHQPTATISGFIATVVVGVLICVGGAVLVGLDTGFGDSDTTVPAPAPLDREQAAEELARATQAHGICYGWRLNEGSWLVSMGSNLGDKTSVQRSTASCPRWMELVLTVTYTDPSSEAEDYAATEIHSSNDLPLARMLTDNLARLGLTQARILDDPADSVLRGVLALPLLLVERGDVAALPAPAASAAATASPLPAAGNDFWRARQTAIWWSIGLIVAAGLLALLGVRVLRENRVAATKRAAKTAAWQARMNERAAADKEADPEP